MFLLRTQLQLEQKVALSPILRNCKASFKFLKTNSWARKIGLGLPCGLIPSMLQFDSLFPRHHQVQACWPSPQHHGAKAPQHLQTLVSNCTTWLAKNSEVAHEGSWALFETPSPKGGRGRWGMILDWEGTFARVQEHDTGVFCVLFFLFCNLFPLPFYSWVDQGCVLACMLAWDWAPHLSTHTPEL